MGVDPQVNGVSNIVDPLGLKLFLAYAAKWRMRLLKADIGDAYAKAQRKRARGYMRMCKTVQEHDAYGRTLWGAELLLDEGSYTIENYAVPTHVEPAVNAIWRGRRLSTPIGGGVVMQPRLALDSPNILLDEKGTVAGVHTNVSELPAGRWWCD